MTFTHHSTLYFYVLVGTAVLELCGLFVLLFALRRMRFSIGRAKAGAGGRAPRRIAAGLALCTATGMVALALLTGLVLPRALARAELKLQQAELAEHTELMLEHAEKVEAIERDQAALLGRPALALRFRDVADDRRYDLEEFRGDVVLLNFWATWCLPCLREMPDLELLQAKLRPRGLTVIHLSDESRETIGRYAEKRSLANLHVYADSTQWPVYGRPTTYLVDRDGVVREVHVGGTDYNHLAGMVEPYL